MVPLLALLGQLLLVAGLAIELVALAAVSHWPLQRQLKLLASGGSAFCAGVTILVAGGWFGWGGAGQ